MLFTVDEEKSFWIVRQKTRMQSWLNSFFSVRESKGDESKTYIALFFTEVEVLKEYVL